ncbi:MAG: hypothetical protein KJ072_23010 [Verrucomicrobia bacterium]|nr:hypothetical protein [Verrucomicrobiota bacterium]
MAGVLATSSAKAATAGGAVGIGAGTQFLAAVGKVIPFAALIPLLEVTTPLPGLLLTSWIGRMERCNYREQDGFRARLHHDYYRTFLWRFPLMMLLIVVPIQLARGAWGIRAVAAWLALFLGTLTLITARSLVIHRNSFQVGMVVYCGVITIGALALALGWLPPALSSLPLILASVVFIGVLGRNRPVRMDYSLFLRATQNLLETSEVAASSTRKLDRAALVTFARFLGSRWLAVNYRWEADGLALRLPWVKAGFLTNMSGFFVPISPRCSRLLLRTDADVVAHLGERPDTEVFFVSPHRARATRWLRVSLIALVILAAVSMAMVFMEDRQERTARMIIGYRLLPVSFTEPVVRATLAQLEERGEVGNNALLKVASTWALGSLFGSYAMISLKPAQRPC